MLAGSFREMLESRAEPPGLDFPDIAEVVPRLGKEGLQLEGEELAAIGRCVLSALKLRRHILKAAPSGALSPIASCVPDLSSLSRSIFHMLDHEGVLRERQIPALSAIRERIRRTRDEADRAVRTILEDPSNRSFWQTTTPTQRDGRVVLPLKTQYKGRVKGIVHEMSSSGSTVFVEPLEIVEKNNAIVQEENLYRLEVRADPPRADRRGFAARGDAEPRSSDAVAVLDTLLARARYAVSHSCRRAEPIRRQVSLRDARHPLLEARWSPCP